MLCKVATCQNKLVYFDKNIVILLISILFSIERDWNSRDNIFIFQVNNALSMHLQETSILKNITMFIVAY